MRLVQGLLILAVTVSIGVTIAAHDTTPAPFVRLSLTLEGDRLQLDAELPAVALVDANLERDASGRFVATDADAALLTVGRQMANDLSLEQHGDPLAAPEVRGAIAPDQRSATFTLAYRVAPGGNGLSVRLHAFRAGSQAIHTVLTSTLPNRSPRVFSTDGAPERVLLDPGLTEAVRRFMRVGSDVVLQGGPVLLFALCLMTPARRPAAVARSVLAFLAAQGTSAAIVASGALSPDGGTSAATLAATLAGSVAASAIVIAAAQNIVSNAFDSPASGAVSSGIDADARWRPYLAAIFGAAIGVGVGLGFTSQQVFAGVHATAALAAYLATISVGQVWVVALLSSAAGLLYRWGLPARLTTVAVAVFAGHDGLHRLTLDTTVLAQSESTIIVHWTLVLTLSWAALIILAGILDAMRRRGPRAGSEANAWEGAS